MIMNKEEFETKTSVTCTYEEYKKCYCPDCKEKDCPHREAFRRYPLSTGDLGLCPKLNK